ncbi:DNA modification methylase [Elusimicrobium minutum Pei191]|uniref:Methyltransferase n=1 Tax=Elusimicrobium minutum (strain Pei191) TaxID=445932 RepID=B2KDB6_ELUMP|nr:DNA methyltransferase [Elusimicrobium minutum]ACC98512.1 DNA modification methylase [Elusimicrobium minutum Pei191]
MQILKISLNKITPYINNAKEHPQSQIDQIKASILEFGFNDPIAIDENFVIIEGHGRYEALKQLGHKEVEVIQLSHLSKVQKKQYILAHNKIALNTGFDIEKLKLETAAIIELGGKLDILGFTDIDEVQMPETIVLEENIDDLPSIDNAPAVTKTGNVWLLGKHRLLCGDSTKKESFDAISAKEADFIFTDPPYGIDIAKSGAIGSSGKKYKPIIGDNDTATARAFYELAKELNLKDMLIWGANYFADFLPVSRRWLVWNKRGEMDSNNFADGEIAWVRSDGNLRIFSHVWSGYTREGSHKEELKTRIHPTQKPVGVCIDIFKELEPFEVVFDAFMGSGSTLIACEKMKKVCLGIEIDPKYCDLIIERWQNYTGEKAVLKNTGKTYEEEKKDSKKGN